MKKILKAYTIGSYRETKFNENCRKEDEIFNKFITVFHKSLIKTKTNKLVTRCSKVGVWYDSNKHHATCTLQWYIVKWNAHIHVSLSMRQYICTPLCPAQMEFVPGTLRRLRILVYARSRIQILAVPDLHQLWQALILKPLKLEECTLHFWKPLIFINLVLAGQDHNCVLNTWKSFLNKAPFRIFMQYF